MQTIITLIVVACAITYAAIRAIKTFKNANSTCRCCDKHSLCQHELGGTKNKKDKGDCFYKKRPKNLAE